MSDNALLALIERLNSGEANPALAPSEDFAAELSLWTNAEFTFDMPPGIGVFGSDSGHDHAVASNITTRDDPVLGQQAAHHRHDQQQRGRQQNLDLLNLSATQPAESRPLSLLERTRQRNPLNDGPKPAVQEQVADINSFHSLLAVYSAAASAQALQLQQQQALQQQYPAIAPAPTAAPTTPAAAKLLRQPMPKYDAKSRPASKKQKTLPTAVAPTAPTTVSSPAAPSTKSTTASPQPADTQDAIGADDDESGQEQLSAADLFSKDDPDYVTKVAAEEDKRRRNTAASARFRQKKKLREQALEHTAREQTARAEILEARVRDLEMEVRWLRGLIVEKDSRLHTATVSLQGC